MEDEIVIKQTKAYDKFNFIKGNRFINKEHLKAITKSIQTKNLLRYAPIIVNEKNEIVDGQHRFIVAKELGLPISYIKAKDLNFSDIILLNSTLRRWSVEDYLETFIYQGKEDYKILKSFMQEYKLSLSQAMAVLTIDPEGKRQLQARLSEFKAGTWEVSDLKEAIIFIKSYKQIAFYAEEKTATDRDFLKAVYGLLYKHNVKLFDFMTYLKNYPYPLFRRLGVRDYMRQFEDVMAIKKSARFTEERI